MLNLQRFKQPKWKFDSINLDVIFNDKTVLKDLFGAFLFILNESNEEKEEVNGLK